MREYVTHAVSLDREEAGEIDSRYTLYTEKFGKVFARAKSARRVTSKLAAHLEPLHVALVRLIERRGAAPYNFHVVDALTERTLPAIFLPAFFLIDRTMPLGHPDPEIWTLLREQEKPSPQAFLKILGFDPTHAVCEKCGAQHPEYFIFESLGYRCKRCVPRELRPTEAFEVDH